MPSGDEHAMQMSFDPRHYWETRLAGQDGLQGVGYTALGRPYNEWLYRLRRRVFLRQMRSCGIDFAAAEVLDIGSGTGFYVDRWAELGVRNITGVDLTAVAVTRLTRRYPAYRFHRADVGGDFTSLGLGRFDAISCMDVLFHVVDDEAYRRAIRNIGAALKPGGIAVLSNFFVHGATSRPTSHVVCRSLETEEKTLTEAGLEILDRRPMFVLMNSPMDSASPLVQLFWAVLERTVSRVPAAGRFVGGAMYPLECVLVSVCGESPAAEIMLCRKPLRNGSFPSKRV